jgi:NAD(P)-dependent dehydrogenase (short-subunit alcohol dehydrogenase family)
MTTDPSFEDRVIVVTGGSSGIGAAVTAPFAAMGEETS